MNFPEVFISGIARRFLFRELPGGFYFVNCPADDYIARRSLLGLFLQAGDAVRLAELFSIWLLLSGPVIGLYYIASNYLQATGSALSATVVSVLRQGALLIPLLYLMHAGFGLPGIAIAHALADLIATGIGMALFLRQYRRVCQSAVKERRKGWIAPTSHTAVRTGRYTAVLPHKCKDPK